MTPAERLTGRVPTPEHIEAIARRTLDRLPPPFSDSLGDIVLLVEEVADPDTARSVGLRNPMQLSGLYEGISLNHQSVSHSGVLPERITLYRRPIIAEWQSTRVSLDQLVSHIVIHEVGHHFGFSDDDMHALEDEPDGEPPE
jgi:predicted Zn-dependent protease with MMP-like domain